MSAFPNSLDSPYIFPGVNEETSLYQGTLVLRQPETSSEITSDGVVNLQWLPSPHIRFTLTSGLEASTLSPTDAVVDIPGIAENVTARITETEIGRASTVMGRLPEVSMENSEDCERVLFHLPNFFLYFGQPVESKSAGLIFHGRLHLESLGWCIKVDQRPDAREIEKKLKARGGYSITHIGELTRTDGERFRIDEAREILDGLYWFFSFLRGFRSGPLLEVGSLGERVVWQRWAVPSLDPWRTVRSWPPFRDLDSFSGVNVAFAGFIEKWHDLLWRDALRKSIFWYVESNLFAGGVEGSIILTQAALELLGWLRLVEDPRSAKMSARAYNAAEAAEKLRLLLASSVIPCDIPEEMPDLIKVTDSLNLDGCSITTQIRNSLVHPKKSKREKVDKLGNDAMLDAWLLGMWYLELVLLSLMGYKGNYYRRFIQGYLSETMALVPWA